MVAEFKLAELLDINQKDGIISFRGNRMLIFQSDVLCELRREMINTLGEDIARRMLARFGYRCGFNDVTTFRKLFEFENDDEWLLAGSLMHTLEGIVHASAEIFEYDRQKGNFLMRGIWRNSYEAEHHLRLFGPAKEPVCWTLSGYASGFGTGFMGRQVICVETMCQGMGDPHCRFELRTIEAWNGVAFRNIEDLKQCLVEEERERVTLWRGMSYSVLERTNEKLQEKISELCRVNELLNQEKAAMQKSAAIHNQLTSLVLEGQGLSGITRNLSHIIDKVVLVTDRFFQAMSCSKPLRESHEEIEAIWREAIENPAARQELLALVNSAQFTRLEFPDPVAGGIKNLVVVPILAGTNALGFVAILEDEPLSKLDCIALEHAATVIALEMLKQKAAFETELRLRRGFFEELFAGNYESEDVAIWRAKQLGLDLVRTYRLMTIDIIPGEAEDLKSQNGRARMSESFFEAVGHAFENVCPGFFLSGGGKNIIGLLPVAEEEDGNGKALSTVLREIEKEIKTHLPEYRWLVGIGSPCSRIKDFAVSYQEACATIEIAKELKCKNRCLAYETLGIFSLINIHADRFREFIRKIIGPLIDYDEKYKSQLVDTLKLYFNNNCNLQRSARDGFLSSATLKYRLKRIKEIANIDLNDSETILLVHLAIKLINGI